MVFADRDDAGRRLAARLGHLRGEPVVVLGLPRGGSRSRCRWRGRWPRRWMSSWCASSACRSSPSWAWALGEDGVRVVNPEVMQACGVSQDDLAAVQAREQAAVDS